MTRHTTESNNKNSSSTTSTSHLSHVQQHDREDDCVHMQYTPKVPAGGMRTSKAANSKAFDFDVPIDDAVPVDIPMKHADLLQSKTDPGAAILNSTNSSTNSSSSSPVRKLNLSINTTTTSTVRRNSHDGGSMLSIGEAYISSARSHHSSSSGSGGADIGTQESPGTPTGERTRHNSNGQLLPMLRHSKTTPSTLGMSTTTIDTTTAMESSSSGIAVEDSIRTSPRLDITTTATTTTTATIPMQPPTRLTSLNIHAAPISTGIAMHSYHTPTGSNSATFLHGLNTSHTSSPSANSSRSDESPSPRIHIPPHRQQQLGIVMNRVGGLEQSSPRSLTPYQQYPRPQSAEKRRWLARMNLLRGVSLTGTSSSGIGTDLMDIQQQLGDGSGNISNIHDDTSMCIDNNNTTTTTSNSGELKVAKLAEADDAAVQLIYAGPEKYFYLEYLDWMGTTILQPGVENGEISCSSCKNVLGNCIWHPSKR